jgi:hypothetical protein
MGHKLIGFLENTDIYQNGIDRSGVRKQSKEQHGKCGRHNQVRKIDYGFKETLSFQFQGRIGKPCSQKQRQKNLRNETSDPHNHGILKILQEITLGQELDVILQSYKIRSYLLQAGHIVFKKTVIDCRHKRNQLENNENNHEGDQENITPFIVACDPAFFITRHSGISHLLRASGTNRARPP